MSQFTAKQQLKIKSLIVDTNLNKVFPTFNSLNKELSPSFCLIDTFYDCFSFHSVNRKDPDTKIPYHIKLDNIYENSLIDQDIVLIILDTSIKNNVATLVSYIHWGQDIITKTVHHAINVMSTKAELFAIRCRINWAIQMQNTAHIIIITDAIPAAKWIFDTSNHLHSITISSDLRGFFQKNSSNSISFWD